MDRAMFLADKRVGALFTATLISILSMLPAAVHAAPHNKTIAFHWSIESSEKYTVASRLPIQTEHVTKGRGGPLVILIGAVAAVEFCRVALQVHDELRGGTLIDIRSSEIKIERNKDIPGELIIVADQSGNKMYNRRDISVSALVKIISGSQ